MDERPLPEEDEVEVVDGQPVIAEVREIAPAPEPSPPALVAPAIQAAAVAATGFVAGVATVALLQRRSARRVAAGGTSFRSLAPPSAGTRRTYLVHVISHPLD